MSHNINLPTTGDNFKIKANNSDILTVNGTGNITTTGSLTLDTLLADATLDIDSGGALSLNSSGGVINIGDDAVAQAVNIATGAAARTISVGNTTGATAVNIDAGSGGVTIYTGTSAGLNLTNGTSTSTHKVGQVTLNANQTGTDISELDFTGLETFTIRAKVTEDIVIASYSVANPSIVTTTNHGLSNGDSIYINGATNLSDAAYTVTVVSSTTFTTTPAIDNDPDASMSGGNTSRYAYFTMHGLNKSTGGNEWIMTTNYIGDTLGISFSIDSSSDQIEYTTDTNHAGSMIYEMVSNIN